MASLDPPLLQTSSWAPNIEGATTGGPSTGRSRRRSVSVGAGNGGLTVHIDRNALCSPAIDESSRLLTTARARSLSGRSARRTSNSQVPPPIQTNMRHSSYWRMTVHLAYPLSLLMGFILCACLIIQAYATSLFQAGPITHLDAYEALIFRWFPSVALVLLMLLLFIRKQIRAVDIVSPVRVTFGNNNLPSWVPQTPMTPDVSESSNTHSGMKTCHHNNTGVLSPVRKPISVRRYLRRAWLFALPLLSTAALLSTMNTLELIRWSALAHSNTASCFQRLGATSQDSLIIFVRCPISEGESVVLQYKKDDSSQQWKDAPILILDPKNDFTTSVSISGLESQSRYITRLVDSDGKIKNTPTLRAKTSPGKRDDFSFSFIFGSTCFNVDRSDSPSNWQELDSKDAFFLQLGDLFHPDNAFWLGTPGVNVFNAWYRALHAQSFFAYISSKIPIFSSSWKTTDTHNAEATSAWRNYIGSSNMYHKDPATQKSEPFYQFDYGDATFFVLETATFSTSDEIIDGPDKTLLGNSQFQALKSWLIRSKEKNFAVKFIVSPVPFAAGWNQPGSWNGYLHERDSIFNVIASHSIANVFLLSTAEQHMAVTKFPNKLIEFSVSGLPTQDSDSTFQYRDQVAGEKLLYLNHHVSPLLGRIHIDMSQKPGKLRFEPLKRPYERENLSGSERWSYTVELL